MKKITIIILIAILAGLSLHAQKVISGKSEPTRLRINTDFKRGLPPNLFVEMVFEDDNNNYILEADERARLNLKISNRGKGPAQGLRVTVKDNLKDSELKIGDGHEIPHLMPDEYIRLSIPIHAGFNIQSAEHKLEINVNEHFGYDMDPAYLILSTLKFQEPKIEFAGIQIMDSGEGTGPLLQDGKLQAGELVKVKIVLQNIGQNISRNTKYKVTSKDPNIYITDGDGNIGDLTIGEVKEFWVTLSPNKRVMTKERLPVYLSTSNDVIKGNLYAYQLPLYLEQKPAEIVTLEVKADVEKLKNQIARFEYTSNRITANLGNVIDIRQVVPARTKRTNAVAVIIGLENYTYFANAPYAENDATIIRDYFKNVLGIDNIILYKSRDVTGYFFDNIFDPSFGELQKAVLKGETDVFIYYSGHGIPNKEGNKVYLLPTDGRIEAIEKQGFDLNVFFRNLQALEAHSVTVFMDACFSGISRTSETYEPQNLLAMKGIRIKPEIEEPWLTNPNFTVFTSSDYDQTSLGFDPSETGLFTYYLCAGLQGRADANGDKKITAGELKDYVGTQVTETSSKIRGLQIPQFHGNRETVLTEY